MSAIHPDIAAVLDGSAQWAIVEGDCLDVLAELPDRSVTHVITDPPYSEHVHSKSRAGARKTPLKDGNGRLSRCAISREVDFGFDHITQEQREAFADECARLASRWALVFSDTESSHLWRGALTSAGLDYCRTAIWVKQCATPQFTGDRPAVGHESITIVGYEDLICVHPKGRKRWNGGGKRGVYIHPIVLGSHINAGNDIRINETQKPLSLMMDLVRDFTDLGDIVLDAYAGSATTGVACLRLGRRFIGIEKRAEQVANARERLEAESAGLTLKAKRAGQVSLFGGGA